MIPDPYAALHLPHTASLAEIKRSYRDLARHCHPDRLSQSSEEEKYAGTKQFAAISSAYSLLMDPQRKAQYDHIYKYGGCDENEAEETMRAYPNKGDDKNPRSSSPSRKRKSLGVGYVCTDPFAFLWCSGDVLATKKVAGLQIPSRFQMGQPGGGFQVSISAGEFRYDGDKRQYTSRTTQFAQGKKATKTKTTTIHKDGRKEEVIQSDNVVEKRTISVVQSVKPEEYLPWYFNAWHGLKNKLTMCYCPEVAYDELVKNRPEFGGECVQQCSPQLTDPKQGCSVAS